MFCDSEDECSLALSGGSQEFPGSTNVSITNQKSQEDATGKKINASNSTTIKISSSNKVNDAHVPLNASNNFPNLPVTKLSQKNKRMIITLQIF